LPHFARNDGNFELIRGSIDNEVKFRNDSIASIRIAGIIGDRYVRHSPGASEDGLGPGDEIEEIEPAISLEELVSKYIFDSKERPTR